MEVNGRPSPVLPPSYFYIVLMCCIDKLTWLTSIRLFRRVLICETDGHSSCSCWQTWGEFSLFNGTFWSLGCGSLKESFPAEGWWQDDCQHLESDQTLPITDCCFYCFSTFTFIFVGMWLSNISNSSHQRRTCGFCPLCILAFLFQSSFRSVCYWSKWS